MKRMLGFLGVTLLAAAAMLVGRSGTTQATGDDSFTVQLVKPTLNSSICAPIAGSNIRVDLVEDGATTIHYTTSGSTSFTLATPTNNETITIKYYKSSGALAGTLDVIVNPGGQTSDPWIFGEGSAQGGNCETWAIGRIVHIQYTP